MTAHAYGLIAERQDEPLDPGADAFVQDHLKICAECRRYERAVAHVDELLRMREPALAVPPLAATAAAKGSQRALFAVASVAVVLAAALATGAALREFRSRDQYQGASAPRAHPSDACEIIARAAPLAGYPAGGSIGDHGSTSQSGVPTHACSYDEDVVDRWRDPHLVLVTRAVHGDEVPIVLKNLQVAPQNVEWRAIHDGMWVAVVSPSESDLERGFYSFTAVAVFDEPYFFWVSERNEENAVRVAEAVRTVLRSR